MTFWRQQEYLAFNILVVEFFYVCHNNILKSLYRKIQRNTEICVRRKLQKLFFYNRFNFFFVQVDTRYLKMF